MEDEMPTIFQELSKVEAIIAAEGERFSVPREAAAAAAAEDFFHR